MATVGGEGVSLHEFQMTYTNLTDFYRRVYQDRFTEDFARSLNLKQQALIPWCSANFSFARPRGKVLW